MNEAEPAHRPGPEGRGWGVVEGEVAGYPGPDELRQLTFAQPNAWRERFVAVLLAGAAGSYFGERRLAAAILNNAQSEAFGGSENYVVRRESPTSQNFGWVWDLCRICPGSGKRNAVAGLLERRYCRDSSHQCFRQPMRFTSGSQSSHQCFRQPDCLYSAGQV